MKIVKVTKASMYTSASRTTALNTADMATLAKNNILFEGSNLVLYLNGTVQGASTFITSATELGGTGIPESEINAGFYPYATAGAECAAVVTSLDWANKNLAEDYEYVKLTGAYFVSGTLVSSESEFNDPFATGADFVGGGCWASTHAIGVQPF